MHGGLRYLAKGQVDVAHESAVERGILMQTTAPHLIRALPMLMPLTPEVSRSQGGARPGRHSGPATCCGWRARTGRETLPRPRRIGVTETLTLAPVVRRDGLRGGAALLGRPARGRRTPGPRGRPHRRRPGCPRAHAGAGQRADRAPAPCSPTPAPARRRTIRARTVINATGVWAGDLVEEIRLRPSRGTHLVLRKDTLPGVRCAIMAPVPGASNRFVFALPAARRDLLRRPHRRGGRRRDPRRARARRRRTSSSCCGVINSTLRQDVRRDQVVGAYAGLRPLLDTGQHDGRHLAQARGAGLGHRRGDRRRRQADHLPADGPGRRRPGGAGVRSHRRTVPHRVGCPLLGAGSPTELAALEAPAPAGPPLRDGGTGRARRRRRRRPACRRRSCSRRSLPGIHATLAELVFGITHEGASDGRGPAGPAYPDRAGARGPRARRARGREGARPAAR